MKNTFLKFVGGLVAVIAALFIVKETGAVPALDPVAEITTQFLEDHGVKVAAHVPVAMWERELMHNFRHENSWLSEIASKDNYVNNNAINLTEIGVDPAVIVDNSSWPLAAASREDNNNVVALHSYDTEVTIITRAELYANPIDKEGSVLRQHREVLEEYTAEHGLWYFAPATDGAFTPILETTGPDDGTGRARMIIADIIRLQKAFNDMKVPMDQRVLVLSSQHMTDLLIEDKDVFNRHTDHVKGAVNNRLYSFTIYMSLHNPQYVAGGAKKAFKAAAVAGDVDASVAFTKSRAVKARGDVNMAYDAAENNPRWKQTEISFDLYFIAMPKQAKYYAAIKDGSAS